MAQVSQHKLKGIMESYKYFKTILVKILHPVFLLNSDFKLNLRVGQQGL